LITSINNTLTEHLILGCLSSGPKSLADIKDNIFFKSPCLYSGSRHSIYPILKKHESNGLLTAQTIIANHHKRKLYQLTDFGLAVFKEWMLMPSNPMAIRLEMLVKLWLIKNIAPQQQMQQIDVHVRQLALNLKELKECKKDFVPVDSFEPLLFDWGEKMHTFLIEWFNKTFINVSRMADVYTEEKISTKSEGSD
jgi:DNA-binding PadR family transcriptional regulator